MVFKLHILFCNLIDFRRNNIMDTRKILLLTLLILLYLTCDAFGLPAFPGAVGFGKDTVGGRGGKVLFVTNLNNSGSGSLRDALSASGARYIIFKVSGTINLTSILEITNPYVTIAGQTSPGGIGIAGKQFNVGTHDVIIQHLRFRSGGHEYTGNDSDGDSLSLWGRYWNGSRDVYNVIIDHCSIEWGTDESFSVTGGAKATTIQSCIIAEGLWYAKDSGSNHSKGLFISGKYQNDVEVSLYRNYIAHNYDRNPLIWNPTSNNGNMQVDVRNNVMFNWYHGLRPMFGGGDNQINWIGNLSKEGPQSNRFDAILATDDAIASQSIIYIKDSYGVNKSGAWFGTGAENEWLVSNFYSNSIDSTVYRKTSPYNFGTYALPNEPMNSALAQEIVNDAGASKPVRDSVDVEIVNSFASNKDLQQTGGDKSFPKDWPTYSTPSPPTDSDSDGMADSWEISTFGSLSTGANTDTDGDGYTNLEEYLQYLSGNSYNAVVEQPKAPTNLRRLN